jgi:hypothetical protein
MIEYAKKGLVLASKIVEGNSETLRLKWVRPLNKNEFYYYITTIGSKVNEVFPPDSYDVKCIKGHLGIRADVEINPKNNPLEKLMEGDLSRWGNLFTFKTILLPQVEEIIKYGGFR